MPTASFDEFMESTGGTGLHYRMCMSKENLPKSYVEGAETRKCYNCKREVWYDPKASVYPPGEIILCDICLPLNG
jgi:hypothetical protein